MARLIIPLLTIILWFPASDTWADGVEVTFPPGLKGVVVDHRSFYSSESLGHLTLGFGAAFLLANSGADREIQDWYQENLESRATDDISSIVKPLGNGRIAVPTYLCALLLGKLTQDTASGAAIGGWAGRSLRALLVGAPPVLFLQVAVGSSRPREGDSRWHPFEDDNGVSGHSFVGAVPFLSAGKMTKDRYLRSLFYAGSTLCGLSRINDGAHYFSQAALGWWVAYLACANVERTKGERKVYLMPVSPSDGGVVGVEVVVHF